MGMSGHAPPLAVVGVTISFTIVAILAVCLRLYSRLIVVKSAGKDDAFITIAAFLSVGLTVAQCYQVKYGTGRHIAELSGEEQIASLKPLWASIVVYNLALFFAKFSILLQYLRIFPYRIFRILCYTAMVFLSCWSCWTVFSSIFLCTPVEAFWNVELQAQASTHCFDEMPLWFTNAGVNIVTDIVTAALPLPFLNRLQLPKRQKIALMVVFGLGGFACILSILRLESLLNFVHSRDIYWDGPLPAIWSSLEVDVAIFCSCLPTLKTLAMRVFPRIFQSSIYSRSGYGSAARKAGYHPNRISLDTLGKGLSGRDRPNHTACVHSGRSKDGDSCDEIEFATRGQDAHVEDGIHVVTVVEQAVERSETPAERRGREEGSLEVMYPERSIGRKGSRHGVYYEP